MPLILNELLSHLERWDEVYLLERLGITSEMLVERFSDLIEERFDSLEGEVLEDDLYDDGNGSQKEQD